MFFTSQVLCNLLKAHVEAYKELKMLPGGQEACIGLVHQHIKFVPKTDCCSPHIGQELYFHHYSHPYILCAYIFCN